MVLAEMLLSWNGSFFDFWGYVLVFCILFIESVPFVGVFIPGGSIILLLSGILAQLGYFSAWKILIGSIGVIIFVDVLGYLYGRYRPRREFSPYARWNLINKEMFEEVGGIIHGHRKKALLFGRINPITRSFASFIMGSERVNFWEFFLYNFIGAAIWVGGFFLVGYLFVDNLTFAKNIEEGIILITMALAGIFYLYCLSKIIKKRKNKCRWSNKYGLNCKK